MEEQNKHYNKHNMSSSFICEKCGSTSFEQMTYTQARCLQCGWLNLHDSGYKGQREFQLSPDKDILNVEEKVVVVSAPMIKRFVNYLVDNLFMAFMMVIIASIAHIDIAKLAANTMSIQLYSFPLLLVYYTLMEFAFGKTIGKVFTKTRVVSIDGKRLGFGQCIFRSICRIIPIDFISGFFFEGNFWHDSIPKTMVIED